MAGTVGSYQQGVFSTPVNGTLADASVVLSNDNNVRTKHNSHDNDATIHVQSSTLASRPAAGTAQRIWFTTDGLRGYIDSGAAWAEIAYLTSSAAATITTTTTPQFTIAYDGSNNVAISVSSAGAVTYNATGASAGHTFSDPVTHSSTTTHTGATTFSAAITYGGVALSNAVTGTGSMVLSASPTFTGTVATAALTASGLITGSAGVTVASGQTLTLTGATVAGTPTWSSSQAITLSTAAQPNVTSLGTLTSLTVSGTITANSVTQNIRVGATSSSDDGFIGFSAGSQLLRIQDWATATKGLTINTSTGAIATSHGLTVANGFTVSAGTTAVQALTATDAIINGATNAHLTLNAAAASAARILFQVNSSTTASWYSTVANEMILLNSAGSGVVTINNGALAITGALSGVTTINATGAVTTTGASAKFAVASPASGASVLDATGLGTNSARVHFGSAGGDVYFGSASSAGGSLVTGSAAYSAEYRSDAGHYFGNGATLIFSIAASGAVAMTGALSGVTTATFSTSIQVGGGTAITKILSATKTHDYGTIAAGDIAVTTVTVTGAATGDVVIVTQAASVDHLLATRAYVSAADTVTIIINNHQPSSGVATGSITLRVWVIKA